MIVTNRTLDRASVTDIQSSSIGTTFTLGHTCQFDREFSHKCKSWKEAVQRVSLVVHPRELPSPELPTHSCPSQVGQGLLALQLFLSCSLF